MADRVVEQVADHAGELRAVGLDRHPAVRLEQELHAARLGERADGLHRLVGQLGEVERGALQFERAAQQAGMELEIVDQ